MTFKAVICCSLRRINILSSTERVTCLTWALTNGNNSLFVLVINLTLMCFSCADPSADPSQCPNGTYAPSGSLQCQSCPKGSHCPSAGLAVYIPCVNGTYTDSVNQTSCQSCPAGQRCPNPAQAPEDCPSGTYSKGSAADCIVCPEGHRWVAAK